MAFNRKKEIVKEIAVPKKIVMYYENVRPVLQHENLQ